MEKAVWKVRELIVRRLRVQRRKLRSLQRIRRRCDILLDS
jgi:hypothetical protein